MPAGENDKSFAPTAPIRLDPPNCGALVFLIGQVAGRLSRALDAFTLLSRRLSTDRRTDASPIRFAPTSHNGCQPFTMAADGARPDTTDIVPFNPLAPETDRHEQQPL